MVKAKKKMTTAKVGVSRRAVIQRVNRSLLKQEEMLKTWRSGGVDWKAWEAGDLYLINIRLNALIDPCVDLEQLARNLGVLKQWEAIKE